MWIGPALLALAGLALGLAPQTIEQAIVAPATSAILGRPEPVELYLWHGLNLALMLSAVSVAGGLALYMAWVALRRSTPWLERAFAWGPDRWYQASIDGIDRLARIQTRLVQSGHLHFYLLTILLTMVGLVGWTLISRAGLPATLAWTEVRVYEAGLAVLMLLAAGVAVRAPGRLSTVAALGVVGYGVVLIYILYGAPDLAMTQILVETLTVILFVLVFYHMPRFGSFSGVASRVRDAAVALASGGLVTALVLAATATPPESGLAPYFAENSKPLAHGRNIVNVILVDFRGLDTLGEITVLAVAAIGVYALLKLRRRHSA